MCSKGQKEYKQCHYMLDYYHLFMFSFVSLLLPCYLFISLKNTVTALARVLSLWGGVVGCRPLATVEQRA